MRMAISALEYSGHFDDPALSSELTSAVEALKQLQQDLGSVEHEFNAQVALEKLAKGLAGTAPQEAAVVETMMQDLFFSKESE